jgi:rhamnose transport system permease protein
MSAPAQEALEPNTANDSRAPRPGAAALGTKLTSALLHREASLLGVLILVCATGTILAPHFLTLNNVRDNILVGAGLLVIVAVGETLVVVTRNIDLSVGSATGLAAYLTGAYVQHHPHAAIFVVLLMGIGIGLVLGVTNAVIVVWGDVPSIVATLGTLYIYRGIDFVVYNGNEVVANNIPQRMLNFPDQHVVGIPVLVIFAATIVGIAAYGMRRTRAGRGLYAVGSNAEAARLSGVKVDTTVFTAYTISGALCGLAGALYFMYYAGVDGTAATGFELTVVAAVVVGGVAIFGGSGTVVGAALGGVLLTTIQNALNQLSISGYWLQAIYGAAILSAVMADLAISRRIGTRHRRGEP